MFPLHDDNPTQRTPYVTVALIVACALVFLWQISLDHYGRQHAVFALGAIPAVLFDSARLPAELVLVPAWATAFTSCPWNHSFGILLDTTRPGNPSRSPQPVCPPETSVFVNQSSNVELQRQNHRSLRAYLLQFQRHRGAWSISLTAHFYTNGISTLQWATVLPRKGKNMAHPNLYFLGCQASDSERLESRTT